MSIVKDCATTKPIVEWSEVFSTTKRDLWWRKKGKEVVISTLLHSRRKEGDKNPRELIELSASALDVEPRVSIPTPSQPRCLLLSKDEGNKELQLFYFPLPITKFSWGRPTFCFQRRMKPRTPMNRDNHLVIFTESHSHSCARSGIWSRSILRRQTGR